MEAQPYIPGLGQALPLKPSYQPPAHIRHYFLQHRAVFYGVEEWVAMSPQADLQWPTVAFTGTMERERQW